MAKETWLDDEVYFNSIVNKTVKKFQKKLGADFIQNLHAFSELDINSFGTFVDNIRNPELDEESRLILCWLAGKFGDKRIAPDILNLFYDGSIVLTWQAAQTLRLLESKKVVDPLIEMLKKMEPFEKRKAVAYALGAVPDLYAVEALKKTLLNKNEHPQVRGQAAESLAFVGKNQPPVIVSLLSGLSADEVEVRFWSVYSLGHLGTLKTIPALEKLRADKNVLPGWWSVGEEANSAIAQITARG